MNAGNLTLRLWERKMVHHSNYVITRTVALLVLCAFAGVRQAGAQALYGSIVGIVTDSSGAAIGDAAVKVTQTETNQSRNSTTNESGQFNFTTLPAGTYDVTITRDGFRAYAERGVRVTVSSVVRVTAGLEVGAVTESVRVDAQAATLQTDSAEVRTEITRKSFEELPVPGNRNYQNLLVMVPGFSPPANAHSVSASPSRALQFSSNGTSQNSNVTRIEGAAAVNVWLPHVSAYIPGLESIETVSVATASFDADQGLAGGAAINVQMKSGTNQLHGSLFEYHTDNAMKAKPFFLPQRERNPKAIDNQLGGTIGGPIRKDKLFFFAGYDGQFIRQTGNQITTVPTAAIRAGDMSASPNQIYDPLTGNPDGTGRLPFAGNLVPQARMDQAALKMRALIPLPNLNADLTQNYYANGAYRVTRNKLDSKVNWRANSKLSISGRLGVLDYDMINPAVYVDVGGPISSAGGREGHGYGQVYNSTISATYVARPTFILDSYVSFTLLNTFADPPHVDEKIGLDVLKIPGTNGPTRRYGGYPQFSATSYTAFGKGNNPIAYYDPAYDYVVNGNWTKGKHNIRFGIDVARQANNNWEVGTSSFAFNGNSTSLNGGPAPNQFNSFADFLIGYTSGAGSNFMQEDRATTRTWAYSLHVGDRWQVSRKLTLSLGTRWDYFPMGTSKDRGFRKYDFSNDTVKICGEGPIPRDCGVQVPGRNFSPRLGLAYRATDSFVIRAGYGINFDPQPLAFARDLIGGGEHTATATPPAAPNSFTRLSILSNGLPAPVFQDFSSGVITLPKATGINTPPDRYSMGYIQSWNFSVQKQIGWGFIGQTGYVGTRQIKQLQLINNNYQTVGGGAASMLYNQKFGRTGAVNVISPFGHNSYDSLQSTLARSFTNGIQFNAVYTFSKAIGLCCNVLSDGGPAIVIPEYIRLNKALAPWDRTHNFHFSTVAELPFGRNKRWLSSGGMTPLFSGWQLNTLLSRYSGTPFSVSATATSLNAAGSAQRADQIKPAVAILGGTGGGQSYFDPLAFAPVTAVRFGTAGFNTVRGPGLFNADFGIVRNFKFNERWEVQFRGEALNLTNTPHFSNPNGNVSNLQLNPDGSIRNLGGYTVITGTTGTGREGIDERVFRVGLRIRF